MDSLLFIPLMVIAFIILKAYEHKETMASLDKNPLAMISDTPNYNLNSDEAIIMRCKHVNHEKKDGELMLTNLYLVFIAPNKVITKTMYITEKFPINAIKKYNGEAQIFLGKRGKIEINFASGMQTFQMRRSSMLFSSKDVSEWVATIKKLAIEKTDKSNIVDEVHELEIDKSIDGLLYKTCDSCGTMVSGEKGMVARCIRCGYYMEL